MYALSVFVRTQNAYVNKENRKMRISSSEEVLARLAHVMGVKTDRALADALDVSPTTFSSWKSRDSIPYEKCVHVASTKGISLDWLITGVGDMRRGAVPGLVPETPREEAVLALFRELTEGEQREIQQAVEEKKRLREVERKLAEMSAALAAVNRAS